MSDRVYPSKFYVPALPPQYIGHFGPDSSTTEAVLLRLLLQTSSASPSPAVVVKGLGGTGKTTALLGVGNHSRTFSRFPDAVWFVPLGQHGNPPALVENLETVVRDVVGGSEADKVVRLSNIQNKSSAVAEAIRLLNRHAVLLLLDDVWTDEESATVGQSTVFSLVQDSIRRVRGDPGDLRVVVSTRNANVAALVPSSCRVTAEPFDTQDSLAREMLCRYAEMSFEDIRNKQSPIPESFAVVQDRCRGLQLALAIAGRGVRKRIDSGAVQEDGVWYAYAKEVVEISEFLKVSHPDHPGVYAMLQSSLEHLKACLEKDGIVLPDDLRLLFSLLAVLNKQDSVPLSVVKCLWGLSKEETLRLCIALTDLHLMSLREDDGVQWISVHEIILDFGDLLLRERPGRKSFAHRVMAEGLEQMLLGVERLEGEWGGCAAFWKLGDAGLDVDAGAREYCLRNIARHQVEAGAEYVRRFFCLVTDYRWVEARMQQSRGGNDLDGLVEDVQIFLMGCREDLDEEVRKGLELLSDAASLSMAFVASNPRELAYQLEGRLKVHAGLNAVVDRFLWTLERHARRPWLRPGKGMLKAAGGAVVLNASLPNSLRCVAVLPNGDDVVVGGDDGYLAVFSIRYASELYKLRGHRSLVRCVVYCAATSSILSSGDDGTVRKWALGSEQRAGQVIFRQGRVVWSLAVTADGSRVVFGDGAGLLTVCDSTSGDVMHQWHGHSARIISLTIRTEDGMIVSGSSDGTIGRWEFDREIANRIAVGGGRVMSVVLSRDGKRIAYGATKKIGVVDAGTGVLLRECSMNFAATCVIFCSDDETVHFGRSDGTTAALSIDGLVFGDVQAHDSAVVGLVKSCKSRRLVSVSHDCTLSVQNLDRLDSSSVAGLNRRYKLWQFVVLPDRRRILYCWWEGSQGLKLLNLNTMSLEAVLSEEALVEASATIGCADDYVTAIAASRDGRWVVAGTWIGEVVLYDTNTWSPRHADLRLLREDVLSTAISNDGTFMAAGSRGGDLALFRLEDGIEVRLPSSAAVDGEVMTVAFSEENSTLLAAVGHLSQATGMLHVWKHIDQAANVEHVALPFSRISRWMQPRFPTSMIATNSHIATRYLADSGAYLYDFAKDQCSMVASEDEEDSGLFQLSKREHVALESEGALFMDPFGRAIKYRDESGSEVLGTLEAPICQSFRPEQWTFNEASHLFIAGGLSSTLLGAILVKELSLTHWGEQEEEPALPPIHKSVATGIGGGPSGIETTQYIAFISHAGPDKRDVAIPLYRRLVEKGISTFVDKEELRPGDVGDEEMVSAMRTADVGVFITSPEFACREWPMRELACFLSRRKDADSKRRKPPVVVPVYYRLNVYLCQSNDLFNKEEVAQTAVREGFYGARRQEEMPIRKALKLMKGLASFNGIENEEDVVNDAVCTGSRIENQMRKVQLIERVVDGVVEARRRRDAAFEKARASRRGGFCTVA